MSALLPFRRLGPAIVLAALALAAFAPRAEAREYVVVEGANFKPLPLAIEPASGPKAQVDTFTQTLDNDLRISGLFNVLDPHSFLADMAKEGTTATSINFAQWRAVGADSLVKGKLTLDGNKLSGEMWLFDCVNGAQAMHETDSAGSYDAALLAHRWANKLVEHFTGTKGVFLTRIAFVRKLSTGKEIWVSDFDGHNAVSVTPGGGLNLLPGWSRDGRRVVYTSYRNGSPMLYTVDVGSHIIKSLPMRGELQTGAVFSPDGRQIAFTMSEHGNSDIYVMNADGSALHAVTFGREIDASPSWSPDGKRLAFVSARSGDPQIFVMNADGSNVQRVTFQGHYNQTPCWSPRGDVIAFTARDERNVFDIFTVDVESKQIKRLTQDTGSNEHPSFSPDGSHVVFISNRGGKKRLWVMNADGTNQLPLALDAEASSPAWGPWTD